MLEKVTWPVVTVIVAALAAIVVLGVFHVDSSVIITALSVMGVGGSLGLLSGIKSNVNGNLSQLITVLQGALEKLSQAQALPPTPPTQPPAGPDASQPGT